TETVARGKRKEFCDEDDNKTNTLCAGAVLHFCAIDPYDALCDENTYSRQQAERAALCIKGANASDADLCTGAIGQDECINNPFGAGCDNKLTARIARETFCRAGNEDNGLCAGAVAEFCTADPFDSICKESNFDTLIGDRATRVTACITGDNASDDVLCANAIKDDSCILAPYDSACESKTTARMMREAHCRAGNEGSALCMGAVVYFCDTDERNVADPFDALCDPTTYAMQRANRLMECENRVVTVPPFDCTNALRQMGQVTCETHPYGAECEGNEFDRITRENHCRMDNNRDTVLCQGAVTHFCTIDPFDSLCNATNFTRYTEARSVFEGFCRADVTPVEGVDCT
ncbi:MAG: hypothetical protein K8953_05700, partial [Proteobacteria bacterium]|nr:hypothetical protein [Pseudomonadota bacterium]